jgi:hypothetical protein
VTEPVTDTIPRLHRVIAHAGDQLRGIAEGSNSFEDCRIRYGRTQERLVEEGKGRVTAPREGVGESERNWAPTKDALSELMRWGAVEDGALPSARTFLDRYRGHRYELTELGLELATLASVGGAAFVDRVSEALIAAHPYVRAFLLALEYSPVVCPAVTESDIERGRLEKLGTQGWGRWASERIGPGISAEAVAREIQSHLSRRFGNPPTERPTNKALQEATNDAFTVAGFAARGLQLDATSIKTILRWGSELLISDQSRYVPDFPGSNVIWLAADLERGSGEKLRPVRRGRGEHGAFVADAVVRAYRQQSVSSDSSLASPYLPIHAVRAQAAFETGVTRALVDLIVEEMADGDRPMGADVQVHIGTTSLPNSEPAFRHHGRRRLEMTMSTTAV